MEIKGTSGVDRTYIRRGAKSAGANDASFSVTSAAGETHAQVVASPGPIAALESILSLQELEDSTDGRSKGIKQGEQLLDMLDQVRDGLLAGGIPRSTLNRLAGAKALPIQNCRKCSTRSSCAPMSSSPSSKWRTSGRPEATGVFPRGLCDQPIDAWVCRTLASQISN